MEKDGGWGRSGLGRGWMRNRHLRWWGQANSRNTATSTWLVYQKLLPVLWACKTCLACTDFVNYAMVQCICSKVEMIVDHVRWLLWSWHWRSFMIKVKVIHGYRAASALLQFQDRDGWRRPCYTSTVMSVCNTVCVTSARSNLASCWMKC